MINTCQKIIKKAAFADRLLIVLVFFTCTFFVYRDFGIRMIFGYAVLGAVLAMHILRNMIYGRKLSPTCMEGLFLFIAVVILINFFRPDARFDDDTRSYVIAMTICALFVLLARQSVVDLRRSLCIMRIAAYALSVYVVFFLLFEDIFWMTVYPHLSETAAEYLAYYVPKGYSITVGGVTYTNYILLLGIACSAGTLLMKEPQQKSRYWHLLEIAYFSCVILLTGRRGEFLGVLLTCAVLFVMTGTGKHRIIRAVTLVAGALACLGLLILALPLLKKVDVLYRHAMTIEQIIGGEDVSSGRIELYRWALELFTQKPIFGIGWARFAEYITPEFREIHGAGVADVHCIYLQFLCETGLVGAVLIILPMGYLYIQTLMQFVRLRKSAHEIQNRNVIVMTNSVSFVIQSFLLIMGIYDPCFQRVVFWCFYGISIILSASALKHEGYMFDDKFSLWIRTNGNRGSSGIKKIVKRYKRC